MATDRHGSIRQRAYEIWEREGKPNDAHERHWRQAEDEIDAAQAAKPTAKRKASAVKPAAQPAKPVVKTAKSSTKQAGAKKG
jgi:hypothetical protein